MFVVAVAVGERKMKQKIKKYWEFIQRTARVD